MKKIHFIAIITLIIILGLIFIYRNYFKNEARAVLTVIMNDEGFVPANFTVAKNTKVIWVNKGTISHWSASDFHPTHGIYPEFDSLTGIEPNAEWTFKFNKVGIWRFHDHLNPGARGTVKVE